MASYTAISSGDLDPEAPIKTGTMHSLNDNVEGSFAGLAPFKILEPAYGVASIPTSAYKPASIDQAALKVAQDSQFVVIGNNSTDYIIVTGGNYTLSWFLKANYNNAYIVMVAPALASSVGLIAIRNNGASTETAYIQSTYFQASPPHDIGDGDIQLFVYLKYNSSGDIVAASASAEPPWYYNGPNRINPNNVKHKNGKMTVRERPIANMRSWLKSNTIATPNDYWLEREAAKEEDIVIDFARKNIDMDIIPHPFGELNVGEKVVLLDPVSPIIGQLAELHDDGESVLELINDGSITVGNIALHRAAPVGVDVVDVSWSLTRATKQLPK